MKIVATSGYVQGQPQYNPTPIDSLLIEEPPTGAVLKPPTLIELLS
ncbi:MAG: hypothetical protein AAFQ98_16750 [Bacteroidota bacterium]